MSTPQTGSAAPQPAARAAGVRRSGWPGWIWAIPLAAIGVVAWLGLRTVFSGNQDITIEFPDAHGIKAKDTEVDYRGVRIGTVTSIDLAEHGDSVMVTASIDGHAAPLLREGTRFWLRGATPQLSDPQSLSALLSGPTLVMDAGPGRKSRHFHGLVRQPVSPAADAPRLLYAVSLSGEAGALKPGDPVELDGFTIGEVRDVGFEFDAASGALSLPATVALYPGLFHAGQGTHAPSLTAVRNEITLLVHQGFMLHLQRDPPLVGSYHLTLAPVPGTHASEVADLHGLPQLPLAPEDGIGSLLSRLGRVPVEQIAGNVLETTRRLRALSSSPQLDAALRELNAALAQVRRTTVHAGPQITALAASLRRASQDLERTARSGDRLLNGTASQDGVPALVEEAAEASRSVRALANYLEQHPESLLRGRGEAP